MEQNSFLENDVPVEFLYLDRPRILSLIGQLSDKGVLTALKSVTSRTQQREGNAGASLPGIAQVGGKKSRTTGDMSEETYDPFWTNAYTFLQHLEQSFAIPLHRGSIGSMVKFEAMIQFIDLRMMRNLWGPSMEAYIHSQSQEKTPEADQVRFNRKKRRAESREQKQQLSQDAKIGLEIIKEVPHLFHMTFWSKAEDNIFRLWASIKPEYLTINSEDLTMKYGSVLDGMWQVVGIVDAAVGEPKKPFPMNPMMDGVTAGIALIREQVGRPADHFGLTPIAIYTPLKGIAEAEAEVATTPTE